MKEKNKRTLLIVAILLSLVPAVVLLRYPTLHTLQSVSLYISALLGYFGITTLLWSYILGAKSVMGLLFHDLAPVISIHKWLGKYGTIGIFLHPLLITYSYGEGLFYSFVLQTNTQFDSRVTLGRLAFYLLIIIWLTSAIVRDRITFRPWRYLHLLSYIALPFALLHVPGVGSQFTTHIGVKIYYFTLVSAYVVFVLLRIRGLLNLDKVRYIITEHRQVVTDDPSIWILRLRPNSEALVPKPGQYVYIKDGIISEEHPFSILDYDNITKEILVAYRTFGRFTKEIAKRKPGDAMFLSGPFGEFTSEIEDEPDKPVVFIAGGIGVTPMLRHIMHGQQREQWLFYANRSHASALLLPQLKALLQQRLVPIFSREPNGAPNGETGHFSAAMVRKYLGTPEEYRYYICGSASMMRSVRNELQNLGVPAAHIRQEAFSW